MVGRYYSGYLADDEDLQGAQLQRDKSSNKPTVSQVRKTYDWKALLRPASPCGCHNPAVSPDVTAFSTFETDNKVEKKGKQGDPISNVHGAAQDFSNFVDFLVDMDALDSLQQTMEEAIRKIREVIMEDEEGLLDFKEDVSSSPESESLTISCRKQCFSSSHYSSTSSSEEDWKECFKSKAGDKMGSDTKLQNQCMLDKFVAQAPKKETRKRMEEVAGIVHTKSVTEKSADYYFRQEHFHIWAQLAKSSVGFHEQRATSDFFSKIKKKDKSQFEKDSSFDTKYIEKEITNVQKRPTPSDTALCYPGQQPFEPLDFLEENKLVSALQDIVNQAILELLNTTKKDGSPLFNMADDSGITGDSQPCGSSPGNIDESTQTASENVEEGKTEEEKTEEGNESKSQTREKTLKESTQKSKHGPQSLHKSKSKSPLEKPPSKPKYVPPPLPKSKPRAVEEAPPPKAKYVPPPLPKSKPRPPVEKPPPKPKYVPPPLPKPKPKKPAMAEEERSFSQSTGRFLSRHQFYGQILKTDLSGGHLKGKLYRRQEEIVDFLVENAAKHVLYKYNYEKSLSEKLGFISVPVTKVLLEIMFGFKKLKGSGIRLSSQIDWAEVYQQVNAKRPTKPQKLSSKSGDKKTAHSKPKMITGKVKLIEKPTEQNISSLPEITEIVPLKFPDDIPQSGEDLQGLDSVEALRQMSFSRKSIIPIDSQRKLSAVLLDTEGQNSIESSRQSLSSRRASITSESNRKSPTVLPDTEAQDSVEPLWEASSSRRTSITRESSRKSSTVLLDTEGQNSVEPLWQTSSSRRTSIMEGNNRKSLTILPDTEGQNSVESLRQSSFSQRTSITGDSSRKSSTVLPKI
ncbi:coiled-coil domain-containing protein 116 isoform X1 [Mauremys reevesii]|uniref:coiled-coil domain-containing protein 116 isoform X1 n=1 Tax=Mauremys reevesii TaxID=260615 RepID=UPI00193EF495|nr:coiled-coil domain-containing protein 116 isoform X1 [Mauremys reevesii]XP_039360704.1 coiled-coil domain-containing protein 116 isoform X1 [Mauremys reevesii]